MITFILLILSLLMIVFGITLIIKNKKKENNIVPKKNHKWIILGLVISYAFFLIFLYLIFHGISNENQYYIL